jgi:hypothetical protein
VPGRRSHRCRVPDARPGPGPASARRAVCRIPARRAGAAARPVRVYGGLWRRRPRLYRDEDRLRGRGL